MFKEKKHSTIQSHIELKTILFPPKKLIQKNLIQIGTTSLSVKYENKKVTSKL